MKFDNLMRMLRETDDVLLDRYINCLLSVSLIIFVLIYSPLWLTHDRLLTHDAIHWFGSYYYVLDCLMNWHLPLWDPYGQSGNAFYQNINFLGLLEPISLFYFIWAKIWSASILYSFIYLHITRIVFMSIGAYFVYEYISDSKRSSKIAAVVFFMSFFASSLHQNGFVNLFMTMPWILYFSLKYLDNNGHAGSAKYLYAAAVALGIAFNMYIPVYTLFYLFVFYISALLTRAIGFTGLNVIFHRKRLKEYMIAIVILLLFSAVPFLVFLNDLGSNGELYPYLRAYSSNSAGLVKQMVSDISGTALGNQYHKNDQVSGTFLNLVQLIAPYYWKVRWQLSLFGNFQETMQFIGITSILIILCGMRFRSRFLNGVILTTLVTVMVMTATYAWGQTNIWHTIFKVIFPPLTLIRVYESFLGGHLFNLGLLLAIGLSFFEKRECIEQLYKKRLYLGYFFAFCLLLYALSYMYILKNIIDTSDINTFFKRYSEDLMMHLQTLAYFIIISSMLYLVVLYKRASFLSHYGAYFCILSIILLELITYNWPGGFNKFHLSHNYLKDNDPVVHRPKPDIYDNFSSIYIPAYFRFVTFQEALQKRSAVFPDIFHWAGNVVFTSKRYYELITHVPKENIFAIAGITSPKAKFFERAYITNSRKDVLEKLTTVAADSLDDHILFIETDRPQDFIKFKIDPIPLSDDYHEQTFPFEVKGPYDRIKEVFPVAKSFFADDFKKASREEAKLYGFPEDWRLYILDTIGETDNVLPATINDNNIGRVIIVKEDLAGVLLNGVSKTSNPVFLHSMRSYGNLSYRKEEAGPPLEVFTMVDGKIVATKPFDGHVLFDTLERKMSDVTREIKNTYFSPNKASFHIKNQKAGFFYYADGWSPYWKAYDNGKPIEVLKANYNYKAVFLPAGEHTVTFVFRPWHYIAALAFYFIGLIFGLLLVASMFIKNKKEQKKL